MQLYFLLEPQLIYGLYKAYKYALCSGKIPSASAHCRRGRVRSIRTGKAYSPKFHRPSRSLSWATKVVGKFMTDTIKVDMKSCVHIMYIMCI